MTRPRTQQFVWCLAILGALMAAGCSKSEPARTQTTEAARNLISAGAVVIDVRTAEEYADGHVANAVNIPVQDIGTRMTEVEKLVAGDKTKPIVVYCRSGVRSAKAKKELEAAGYSQVVNGRGLEDLR